MRFGRIMTHSTQVIDNLWFDVLDIFTRILNPTDTVTYCYDAIGLRKLYSEA